MRFGLKVRKASTLSTRHSPEGSLVLKAHLDGKGIFRAESGPVISGLAVA